MPRALAWEPGGQNDPEINYDAVERSQSEESTGRRDRHALRVERLESEVVKGQEQSTRRGRDTGYTDSGSWCIQRWCSCGGGMLSVGVA